MPRRISFHYDPSRKGLGQVLGDLELDVMEVIWKRGQSTVREVLERLRRDVAYSSVITVANRLHRKGLLAREKEGKTYYYASRIDRQELLELATRRILDSVSDIAPPATVVNLMDSVIGDDPEALAELERLIERRKKRNRSK